jgi:catechol 2,3-dioxygenase-like lactoylglutathione lyase family enzyme
MRLHYVGIRVTDLARSLSFYTRVLGLRIVVRGGDVESGRGVWIGLEDPRSKAKLELNWYPPSSPYATQFVPGDGLDHVGFLLGAVPKSRLDSEYRRLLAAGAGRTDLTPESTNGWMACVTDPDGNWIELFRRPTIAEQRNDGGRRPVPALRPKSRKRPPKQGRVVPRSRRSPA